MKRNNVSLENLEKTLATFRADPGKARKTNRLEGVWNLEAGQPQFSARMAFEGGEISDEELVKGFQNLIDSGMAWTLQGSYGRTATALIEQGLCTR